MNKNERSCLIAITIALAKECGLLKGDTVDMMHGVDVYWPGVLQKRTGSMEEIVHRLDKLAEVKP